VKETVSAEVIGEVLKALSVDVVAATASEMVDGFLKGAINGAGLKSEMLSAAGSL
jgi:hypothetical protein